MSNVITIATRKSPLALWQANYVAAQLKKYYPGMGVELLKIVTKGDKILDVPLAKIGGKGLFIKELEVALLDGSADLAVHSMKDVPMELPPGLSLNIICPREEPRDAFVSGNYHKLDELPAKAIIGTSSLRRQCQIKAQRPDLIIKSLRGNVGTRLNKLDEGKYDAIILAAAGLIRLNLNSRISSLLADNFLLPAVGQGAVGIETRSGDKKLLELLKPLHCEQTAIALKAERAMNRCLNGGCQVPVAGYAEISGQQLRLRGLVGAIDGTTIIKAELTGTINNAQQIGEIVAEKLLAAGAGELLEQLYDKQ